MNKSKFLKLVTSGVIVSLVLTSCSQIGLEALSDNTNKSSNEIEIIESVGYEETPVSRRQVADLLLDAASEYNHDLDRKTIIKGYEDNEGKRATRLEALVMISRAFSNLQPPRGNYKNVIDENVVFTDIPKSAKKEIDNLIKGGILLSSDDQKLNGNHLMTLEEVDTIVRRIWAFKGSNLKDDFYNTINKNKLEKESEVKEESNLEAENEEKVKNIIEEIVKGQHQNGSIGKKIKDTYLTISDMEYRNNQGNKPIQKYLDEINNSKSLKDLNEAERTMIKELGYGGTLTPTLIKDFRDNSTYMLSISPPMITFSKEIYNNDTSEEMVSYRRYLTRLLELSGETKSEAEENVKRYLSLEKELANTQLSSEELEGSSTGSSIIKLQDVEKIIPNIEISKLISSAGYKLPKEIILNEANVFESYVKYLSDNNIELLKTVTKITLLQKSCIYLSQEYLDAYNQYTKNDLGNQNLEKQAFETVVNSFQGDIGEIYSSKYFSKESKKDIEKMVKSIVEVYKDRIKRLDWLSKDTKKVAIKKLNKMKFVIGQSSTWKSSVEKIEIKGRENGGSYLKNIAAIESQALKKSVKMLGKKEENEELNVPGFETNAYYNPNSNTMVLPYGMFSFPLYNTTKKLEEKLGGIGTIIAHEISHAFDNNGAKYDEKGKEKNWWKENDYKRFENLCKDVEHFYNGLEAAPGITSDGKQTLEENISDIAGVACTLEIMSKMNNPDYNAFFRSYGEKWPMESTRQDIEFTLVEGTHSTANMRVNRVLGNFEEFYKTYDIKEGDGMYIDPKDRINIW